MYNNGPSRNIKYIRDNQKVIYLGSYTLYVQITFTELCVKWDLVYRTCDTCVSCFMTKQSSVLYVSSISPVKSARKPLK